MQCLAMMVESLRQFGGDEHAADGIARHFSRNGWPPCFGRIPVNLGIGSVGPWAE